MTDYTIQSAERIYLEAEGMYRASEEHDACGVGLIAATDGKASRRVVTSAIDALKAVWHRGAVDADGLTGDGAGIHVEIPVGLFYEHIERTGHAPKPGLLAIGQVFLPRTSMDAQETCRQIVETEILDFGYTIYGWRQVPINASVIGAKAESSRPEIEQIMIAGPDFTQVSAEERTKLHDEFEKTLYIIRRRIEKKVIAAQIKDFYICSLSSRSIIYKGLFLAETLSVFYPDLLDDRFISRFAIFHQRYSTNTFPQWWLAQPFRMIAHNGEINTIRGNTNWMKSHEIRMASDNFGDYSEDIKPVIPAGASDTAALDAVFEAIVRAGRDAPTAKIMLVPEAWSKQVNMPEHHRDMYAFFNSVMEPWDGPAALAMCDGKWACAGVDRSALRPMRYTLTNDGLLFVGSETGMVIIPESTVLKKGRLGPGQMIAVDLKAGKFYEDRSIKDKLAGEADYASRVKNFKSLGDVVKGEIREEKKLGRDALRVRQVAMGQTLEDMELILHPMVEDAKEAVGSMGDDTPLAVISDNPRCLSHFFRQNFSQVTNPPIDSLRENRVMSLKTRFGNFGNVLDKQNSQPNVMVLDSPVLTNGEWDALRIHFADMAAVIDCTFEKGSSADALKQAIARVRSEAERAVQSGKSQLFLSDENISADRAGIPMILAAAGVHTHLVSMCAAWNVLIRIILLC
jgi:glutamate synthase (NADPH) large chain